MQGTGSFTMDGGEISGNVISGGSGGSGTVMIDTASTGTVEITGGSIKNNAVTANGSAIHGGAAGSNIKIGGNASITANTRTGSEAKYKGCAIFPFNGTVTLSGEPTIKDNLNSTSAQTNVLLSMDNGTARPVVFAGLTGGYIGVTGAADTQVSTATTAVAADAAFIHPDTAGLFVKLQGDKLVLKATTTVVYVSGTGNDDNDGSFAHPVATLGLAYAQVKEGGTIRVLSDLTASQQTSFNSAKNITISSYTNATTESTGEGFTVTRDAKLTSGSAFTLSAGKVTLQHITLDGNAMWDNAGMLMTRKATNTTAHQLIQITGGELVLNDGAIVQNHARVTTVEAIGDKGDAIYLTGTSAKLTMNTGAELRNNYTGGTSTAGDGGAVSIWDGALFTMNDGSIMGNTANRMGGAVRVSSTGSNLGQFVINGGSITCNALIGTTSQGGGVSVSGGKLSISSVKNTTPITIKNNTLNDGTVNNVMTVANGIALGDMSGKTSDIGITTAVAGAVFATSALNTDVPYFHSDDLAYEVVLDGDALKLAALSNGVYVADGTANNNGNTLPAGADTNAGTKEAPLLTPTSAWQTAATSM